ncbi:MAG TPA: hypothetical protein VFV50_06970 [Bdellovibrionales bacterium]|nr:hypothetical protein [Bdellovibrionales bacterium]
MSKKFIVTSTVVLSWMLTVGCGPKSEWVNISPSKQDVFEKQFELSTSEATFQQARYDENIVSVAFRALKNGRSVEGLSANDFNVTENGQPVRPFTLSADTERTKETADIIFLVDITGTMVELIETAKKRLAEFIRTSRSRGYHTRMCFATFGDYTVKACSRFYDNNPNDPSTESQVRELLSELSQLRAFRGNGKDPGWPDLDENPMGALVDASKAPWGRDSQRFVILVTDWGFLYSPNNQGTIGDKAPTMSQVTQAIKESQMKVFAVTRTQHVHRGQQLTWDGYNTPFQGEQGIVQTSGGEYYDFDKVLRGEISLDTVLENILDRLNTTYKITYTVDKVPGLDPSLPVNKRNVGVQLNNPEKGQTERGSVTSSMPKGRPEYQRKWMLAKEPLQPESVRVFVDGRELNPSERAVSGGEVLLNEVPAPGAKLRFVYMFTDVKKHLRLEPVLFSEPVEGANLSVYLNGQLAQPSDYVVANDLEGQSSLTLTERVLAPEDPYGIRNSRGLHLKVVLDCGGHVRQGRMRGKAGTTTCVTTPAK